MHTGAMAFISGFLATIGLLVGSTLIVFYPGVDPLISEIAILSCLLLIIVLLSLVTLAHVLHKELRDAHVDDPVGSSAGSRRLMQRHQPVSSMSVYDPRLGEQRIM